MSERALAHVEQIVDIQPIPNADKIEVATVLGWRVVISKADNFKVGDKVVYIEIDSKVPDRPEFEFLRDRKFRVRTIRLRGQYSQGLILSMSILKNKNYEIGTDVTKELGVTYYVPEDNIRKAEKVPKSVKYQSMAARHKNLFKKKPFRWLMKREWGRELLFWFFGKKKDKPKEFPTKFAFIHKTDQVRCENMPWVLQDKTPFIRTQKCDGSSGTFILERRGRSKWEFYVCSRNIRMLNSSQNCFYGDKNYYWEVAKKYDIQNKLKDYMIKHPDLSYVCWQGEICAPGIQSNPQHLTETHLFLFHMIDSAQGFYDIREAAKIWEAYNMEHVPIDEKLYVMPDDFEEFKQSADGCYAPSVCEGKSNCRREGYVYYKTTDPNFSFKNVSRVYLMKNKED